MRGLIDKRILLGTLAAAAIIRAAVFVVWSEDLQADPDAYVTIARTLAESSVYGTRDVATGKVSPTAYRPPLYPIFLAWLTRHDFATASDSFPLGRSQLSLAAVAIFHWLLGVATVMLTMQVVAGLCKGLSGGVRAWSAAAAGLAVAADPILLRQSSLVMTETLATFLAVAAWASWLGYQEDHRWQAAIAPGILLGLSILCRPAAVLWSGLFIALWLVAAAIKFDRRELTRTAAVTAIALMVWSPWIVRNAIAIGRPIATTTHGGYTLLLANNPVLFDHYVRSGASRQWDEERFHRLWALRHQRDLREGQAWVSEVPTLESAVTDGGQLGPERELREDALASEIAWATICRQPGVFAKACIYRVGWLWAAWPARGAGLLETAAVGTWYVSWYVAAAIAMWSGWRARASATIPATGAASRRAWWWRMLPGITLAISITVVHAVYWSNMRMRSVAMPAVYAAVVSASARRYATRRIDSGDEFALGGTAGGG